jgi:hypothetical protein
VRRTRPVQGGVHPQLAAIHLLSVETADGLGGLGFGFELDEGKAARPTGFTVGADVNVLDLAGCSESSRELLFSGAKTEIANEDLR